LHTELKVRPRTFSTLDIYLAAVIAGGMVTLFFSVVQLQGSGIPVTGFIIFALLTILAEMRPVYLPEHCVICVSSAFHLASMLLFGPGAAVAISAIGSGVADISERRTLRKALFNIAQYALCTGLSGVVFLSLRTNSGPLVLTNDIFALLAAVIIYFCLNSLFISVVIALAEGFSVTDIWIINIKDVVFQDFALAAIGILIALIYHQEPAGVLLLLLPLLITYYALHNYMELRTQTHNVLEMLADIIDKRDPYTYRHSQQVAEYAVKIARRMGLSEAEVEIIRLSARIHDLGKLTLDNSILLKPERLTDAEYAIVKDHPRVGAEVARQLKSYQKGADYVLTHHEYFDGKGYPAGQSGEKIPLGGRILSVADAYDAMTSDRPYRKAKATAEAAQILRDCAGTQFDPKVVEAFLAVLVTLPVGKK
jgi:putative nucleotidyltransferase with HDIG domain